MDKPINDEYNGQLIKAVWAPWTDPDSKKTGFILYPTEELWKAIENKEFVVDEGMGMEILKDKDTYTHFERLVFFIDAILARASEEFQVDNPARYVEMLCDIKDEYSEYLEDPQARDDTYRDYHRQVIEDTIEEINCFCV